MKITAIEPLQTQREREGKCIYDIWLEDSKWSFTQIWLIWGGNKHIWDMIEFFFFANPPNTPDAIQFKIQIPI